MRLSKRQFDQMRPCVITRNYTKYAEGSVLVEFGATKVICTASVVPGVPKFLKDSGQGWLSAEYGMLPRATHTRTDREACRGKQGGRTMEIQRLIGRALRQVFDLHSIGENTITLDCDVIQADGGTRTAAITGGCVALVDALTHLGKKMALEKNPFQHLVAAVSVGIYEGTPILDLNYDEDVAVSTDMNIVMADNGNFIEVQGTAEKDTFSQSELTALLDLAKKGIENLFDAQKAALGW